MQIKTFASRLAVGAAVLGGHDGDSRAFNPQPDPPASESSASIPIRLSA